MAKHKKVIITREGYIFLAAVGVLILALIVVAVATSGFGACAPREKAAYHHRPVRLSSRTHGHAPAYAGGGTQS